jgi:polysaccharide deacetylase family protein (PEP-CTERM system associated)
MQHLFTVDVEEYFQVAALEPYIDRSSWSNRQSRLQAGVERLLELLAAQGAQATFFTLGVVAAQNPDLVRRIAAAGHEVASHGWSHRSVTALGVHEFRSEIARSRDLLSELTGQPVLGFRAPNFSIPPAWEWAFDVLLEEGYSYDSSIFPGRGSRRAETHGGTYAVTRTAGELTEVPMTCVRFGRWRLPAAGGAWFRLFPYRMTARALHQAEQREEPAVFYIHPWELDPLQPRIKADWLTRIRHYGGLSRTESKLERLLARFRFTSIRAALYRQRPVSVNAVR